MRNEKKTCVSNVGKKTKQVYCDNIFVSLSIFFVGVNFNIFVLPAIYLFFENLRAK